jgi:hypothetical protein
MKKTDVKSLKDLSKLFLKLVAIGFGGPAVFITGIIVLLLKNYGQLPQLQPVLFS